MYYFIVNKSSGGGRGATIWDNIKAELDSRDVTYRVFFTKRGHHATELASEISSMRDEDIRMVIVGGDGTINEVLNGIPDFSRVRMGIIPVGSANDFVTGAKLEQDPMKALNRILSGKSDKRFDLGEVKFANGKRRYFGISAGIGIDAIVCKKALTSKLKDVLNKIGLGKLTYVLLTIATLFEMERVPMSIRMTTKKGPLVKDFDSAIFLAAMNVPIEGGGVPMAPHASCHDGYLTSCCAYGFNKLNGLLALMKVTGGKHEHAKGFLVEDFYTLEVSCKKPMVVHTDGEYCGEHKKVTFQIMPHALRML